MNAAALDQLRAACRDNRQTMQFLADAIDATLEETVPRGRLRTCLAELDDGFRRGTRVCRHIARNPDAPQPVAVALWAPDVVVCGRCPLPLATASEDRRCDLCRREAEAIHSSMAQIGPLVVLFGACAACRRDTSGRDTG